MKKKYNKPDVILPENKMFDFVFEEKIYNEKNELRNISLIDEKILTIYLNSQEILTAMTICDYPEYLAVGFLFNQNIVNSAEEMKAVEYDQELSVVVVRTNETTSYESAKTKRIKTSGCAMGTVFGEMFEKLQPISDEISSRFKLNSLRKITKEINQTQSLYLEAGAIHGSVLCDHKSILVYMEDVGRHNAVDKITGFMVMEGVEPSNKFLYTTGRLTTEIVLKTVSMGIPLLVSRSGFTKSAVELARKFNLSMVGRFKGNRFMCVSGFERIKID